MIIKEDIIHWFEVLYIIILIAIVIYLLYKQVEKY